MRNSITTIAFLLVTSVQSFSLNSFSTPAHSTRLFSTTEETTSSSPAPAPPSPPVGDAPARSNGPPPIKSNQAEYGVTMDLPDTYVRCGRCATSFALKASDLGEGKGRRVECSVCKHSWFQTPDRLFNLHDNSELVPLPENELTRIKSNLEAGRDPDYRGDAKFYVGNLDFGVTEDDLREVFAEVGAVGDVSLVMGPDGRSRGFAFVTMMEKSVTDACMDLDGKEVKGRGINVKPPNN